MTKLSTHDELILKELKERCLILESEIENKLSMKENLLVLVKENDSIAKSLQQAKQGYRNQESDLLRTLFFIQVNVDKQKILMRKKLNEFNIKQNKIKERFKKLPLQTELEDLKTDNENVQNEIKKISNLYKNTKTWYEEMSEKLSNNFRKKLCEFSSVVLGLKSKNF